MTTLINAGANIEARDEDGGRPLHYAAASGTYETLAALINAGADIEARDQDDQTPPLYPLYPLYPANPATVSGAGHPFSMR